MKIVVYYEICSTLSKNDWFRFLNMEFSGKATSKGQGKVHPNGGPIAGGELSGEGAVPSSSSCSYVSSRGSRHPAPDRRCGHCTRISDHSPG